MRMIHRFAMLLLCLLCTLARAEDAKLNEAALAVLIEQSKASLSDAVLIQQDGKVLFESYFGKPQRPIEMMSATKSIVGLAIGRLIDEGKIKSLDQPVHEFYPEWRQGRKQRITVRHLLDHTSGLQDEAITRVEISPSPDYVQLALAAELSSDPGSTFLYSNKAVNLLSGIVQKASGQRLDDYVRDAFFKPMGITEFHWSTDRAGNPHAMSGLSLQAQDIAKFGQLMLDAGLWKGQRLLSERWIAAVAQMPEQVPSTLLWLPERSRTYRVTDEVLERWRGGGASEQFLARARTLRGRSFPGQGTFASAATQAMKEDGGLAAWFANTRDRRLPIADITAGRSVGFRAEGYLGQYLVVIPSLRLVAVRQVAWREEAERSLDPFALAFPELVQKLVIEPAS